MIKKLVLTKATTVFNFLQLNYGCRYLSHPLSQIFSALSSDD